MALPGIIPDIIVEMADTVEVQPGYMNGYGEFVESGAVFSVPCRISGTVRIVRDAQGREVASVAKFITGGVYDLTTHRHLYTLPERFQPRVKLRAISVKKVSDESGPHHETVFLAGV